MKADAAMFNRFVAVPLLRMTDAVAALLLAADLLVVAASVISRTMLDSPWAWADDVARGLMVALSFFGAAGALARGDNVGVAFFVDRFPPRARRFADALSAVLVVVITASIADYALELGQFTTGQTTGSGLPLELTFYPMGFGAVCMALFALFQLGRHTVKDIAVAAVTLAVVAGIWLAWTGFAPDSVPNPGPLMLLGFVVCLVGGVPIGFALALSALIYLWVSGTLPGVIFAQQMARGIDNFVLLAIPFFILVGYLMEANGMSVRLIELLERLVGRMRGGLNVVMVLSMVIFSGISGS
ncbi:MAG TPA: TRAP transporter large permease subunit, partial [Rhodopila sp.]